MAAGTSLDLTRMQCPGAPANLVSTVLVRASRQFFSDTECWTKTIATATVAGQAEYDLSSLLDELGEVRRILEVKIDDEVVPASWYKMANEVLTFVNVTPAAVEDMDVLVVVVPDAIIDVATADLTSYTAAGLPYIVPISEYALYLLRDMADTPWSNERQAQKHLIRYMDEVSRVRAQKINLNTAAPSRVQFAFFA